MRCLMCAAEMYVTQVVQDDTMPVPGFEHHTLECLECGNIERRLVFTREKTQPVSPSYRRKKERIVKPRTPMEAFERVRRRDAALAAQRAADRTATAAGVRIKEIATEFARKWDNLIPPRQSSPSEPSPPKW
jgi:uncharacterized Zn finger protein